MGSSHKSIIVKEGLFFVDKYEGGIVGRTTI